MTSAYLSVSENTFLELNLASEYVPPGLLYIGVQVEDIASVKDIYESRGARLRETRRAGTQAILSYIIDPQGVPIQLSEYPPD